MTLRPIRSLLCPIELERPSLDALSYAFFLAEAFYASLEVACTRAPLRLLPSDPEAAGRTPHAREEQASRARLDELLRGVTTAVPGRASAHIVEGEMIAEVLSCARRFHSDLVIVGSQFEARPDWLFGASLGEQIASMAPCPTISIHEGGQRQTTRVKHILLPVDPRSELLSLEWTTLFARCFDATVELLYVPSAPRLGISPLHVTARNRERLQLDELRERLRLSGVSVDEARNGDGNAIERILKRTESGGCDLVVMAEVPGADELSGAEPTLAARVRRHASIPVLSVRPPRSHLSVVPRSEQESPRFQRGSSDYDERAAPHRLTSSLIRAQGVSVRSARPSPGPCRSS
jgi:nucleotide-binding universal stress UspA family protein